MDVFYEMVRCHEENTQIWADRAGELEKWADHLLNHRDQRELYSRLSLHHLEIVAHSPRLKEKMLDKLNHKILQYDALLRERAALLAVQQARVLELGRRVQERAHALEPAAMLYQADSRPAVAHLLELSYDIGGLYALQHHKMLDFLNHNGRDKSAFLFADVFAAFLQGVGSKG